MGKLKKTDITFRNLLSYLKKDYEKRYGHVSSFADCIKASENITSIYREKHDIVKSSSDKAYEVSEDTLKDMWLTEENGLPAPKHDKYTSTLNKIVDVLGFEDWESYCNKLKVCNKNNCNMSIADFRIENLEKGDILELGWFPKKYSKVKYLGQWDFVVLESKNMYKKAGDEFTAPGFRLQENKNSVYPNIVIELFGGEEDIYDDDFFPVESIL